jgi:cyclic pyranopterin phosphate synthase
VVEKPEFDPRAREQPLARDARGRDASVLQQIVDLALLDPQVVRHLADGQVVRCGQRFFSLDVLGSKCPAASVICYGLGEMTGPEQRNPRGMPGLIDPFGRTISYLRVSVTDRCDFRCVYCMAEHMTFLPKKDLLTLEELDRLCGAFVGLGVRKLRLTGGEPLVRRNILWLIESLGRQVASGALDELTLTTNGSQLARHAEALVKAGVRRINVSVDTLDPDRFRAITRWGDLGKVLDGIAAAKAAGLAVKINAVALKGVNEDEFDRLITWCGEQGFDLTLIETMPMGDIDGDRTEQYLPLSLVRARLKERWTLEDIDFRTGGPARYVRVRETGGRLGFITPLTHNFCESCNRVRLTCTGTLYMCLGQDDAADLRRPLRASEGNEPLLAAIREAIGRKPMGHDFVIDRRHNRPAVARHMSVTGG